MSLPFSPLAPYLLLTCLTYPLFWGRPVKHNWHPVMISAAMLFALTACTAPSPLATPALTATSPVPPTSQPSTDTPPPPTAALMGRIAFVSRSGGYQVYVMNADGSGKVNLTNNDALRNLYPVWSPDGQRIAFGSTLDGNMEI